MNVLSHLLLKWLSRIVCVWDSTMYVILCPAWLFDTILLACFPYYYSVLQNRGFLLSLARYGWLLGQIFYFLEKNTWQCRSSTLKKNGFQEMNRLFRVSHKPATLFLRPGYWNKGRWLQIQVTEGQYFTTKWDSREAMYAAYFDYLLFK